MSHELTDLHRRLAALTARQPYAVHWQLRTLNSGKHAGGTGIIGEAAQTQLASFSTRKVSLLLACLALVHRGDLHLGQRFAVTAQMKDGVQAGIMKNLAPGVELSLEDHLRQMMITSDNICTQLVFEAIDQVTGDALQWVNDYCSWVGLRATVHREIFPRSADLDWHHSIEHMTVTSPADQAHLLALLGSATHDADTAADTAADPDAAARLHLSPELCRFAVELMRRIYTPLLGARTEKLRFAEKNGRGLRGLSQVGLATTSDGKAVAAVAVFAENIPTQLPDGTPGRIAAYDLFVDIGQAVEDWYFESGSESDRDHDSGPAAAPPPRTGPVTPRPPLTGNLTTRPLRTAAAAGQTPEVWAARTLTHGETTHQGSSGSTEPHALAGAGKLFAAVALAERAEREPNLLQTPVTITDTHRSQAAVGPLRTHTGNLTLALGDALGLIIGTCDAATSLAVREVLDAQGVDLVVEAQSLLAQLGEAGGELFHPPLAHAELVHPPLAHTALDQAALRRTAVTGVEESAHAQGDLLVGETTPEDLVRLLHLLASAGGLLVGLAGGPHGDPPGGSAGDQAPGESHGGISGTAARRVLTWMSQVFEPAGLTYALPGYGPKKVPQWSVSGLELRSPSSSVWGSQGWTSVMIARTSEAQAHAARSQSGLVIAAAHVSPSADPAAVAGRQVSQTLGSLGSAAYWGADLS